MILFRITVKDLHNLTQINFLILAHPFSSTQCLVLAKVPKKLDTKYLILLLDFILTFYPVPYSLWMLSTFSFVHPEPSPF